MAFLGGIFSSGYFQQMSHLENRNEHVVLWRQCPRSNQCLTASLGPEGTVPLCPYWLFMPHSIQTLTFTAVFHGAKKENPKKLTPMLKKKYDILSWMSNIINAAVTAYDRKKLKKGTSLFKQVIYFIALPPALVTLTFYKYCIIQYQIFPSGMKTNLKCMIRTSMYSVQHNTLPLRPPTLPNSTPRLFHGQWMDFDVTSCVPFQFSQNKSCIYKIST